MNIQVIGFRGMLGRAVCVAAATAGHTVLAEDVGPIELAMPEKILAPIVINCAGMVKQQHTSTHLMMAANAVGPHRLAAVCEIMRARLIHVSTDCVFQGGGPHDEGDIPDADGPYALSKRAGEVIDPPHLTLRTSFVGFGRFGLIHDLITKRAVVVSQSLLWTGHTVDTVAQLLVWCAEHPEIAGLIHVPGDEQTRYTLARDLKARWKLPAKLVRDDGFVADRRLTSGKWGYLNMPTLPPFEQQLMDMRRPND